MYLEEQSSTMIRLYLDTNVLTDLKGKHQAVCQKLLSLCDEVLIVASEIHFTDLDASGRQDLIEEDIKLLAQLSQGRMLHLDQGGVHYFDDDVWKLYEHHRKNSLVSAEEILQLVLDTPSDVYNDPTPLTAQQEADFDIYKNILPELSDCNTWGEAMKILIPFSFRIYIEPELFRHFLKGVRQTEVNLTDRSGSWKHYEVFQQMTKQYKPYLKGQTYRDAMNSVGVKAGTLSKKLYDHFEQDYLNLEILGVASDKVKKKGLSMKNLIADIQHSYLAAHCDILCTNDQNMQKKVQILSHEFGYKCQTINTDQLTVLLDKSLHHLDGKTFKSLVDELLWYLKTSEKTYEDTIEGSRALTINLDLYFLMYFNVCSFGYDQGNKLAFILLTRREYSISTNTFKAEIVNLVNRVSSMCSSKCDNNEATFEEIQTQMTDGISFHDKGIEMVLSLDQNSVAPHLVIR